MGNLTIFHNPRCSKSRQTLALLQENGQQPTVVEYLKQIPSRKEILSLRAKLGFNDLREMMRTKEDAYKTQKLGAESVTQEQLLDAMLAEPKLIERPIVVNGDKARIGRPPESVLDIL